MADSTTPRLNTAPVSSQLDYAPIAWSAVAAMGVALTFAVALVVLGAVAYLKKQPLIEPWLFFLAVVGVALAFTARRQIRNSENTRTGENYANMAWWICVIGALIYAAYLGAIEYTIRQDAEKQFLSWSQSFTEIDPTNPDDPNLFKAFYKTLPPGERINYSDTNDAAVQKQIRSIFGQGLFPFTQNRVLTICARNPGACRFEAQGLVDWQQVPGRIECVLAAELQTPEGDFPLRVPMMAVVERGQREWQIMSGANFIPEIPMQRTEYGWYVEWLEQTARMTADRFISTTWNRQMSQPVMPEGIPFRPPPENALGQPLAYDTFVKRVVSRQDMEKILDTTLARSAAASPLGMFWPASPGYSEFLKSEIVTKPNGMALSPDDYNRFLFCWNNAPYNRITMAGLMLGNNGDKVNRVTFEKDLVRIKVPIELRPDSAMAQTNSAIRGHIVFECRDLELMKAVNLSREQTNGKRSFEPPDFLRDKQPDWQVVRFETDMVVFEAPTPTEGK